MCLWKEHHMGSTVSLHRFLGHICHHLQISQWSPCIADTHRHTNTYTHMEITISQWDCTAHIQSLVTKQNDTQRHTIVHIKAHTEQTHTNTQTHRHTHTHTHTQCDTGYKQFCRSELSVEMFAGCTSKQTQAGRHTILSSCSSIATRSTEQ